MLAQAGPGAQVRARHRPDESGHIGSVVLIHADIDDPDTAAPTDAADETRVIEGVTVRRTSDGLCSLWELERAAAPRAAHPRGDHVAAVSSRSGTDNDAGRTAW